MTIQQTLKVVNGRLMPSDEVLDASLIEVSVTENNALQVREDGLFVSSSGGSGPSELPEGQEYVTSDTGKIQRENVGTDRTEVKNLHTQVGLVTNLSTTTGDIVYDGTSNLSTVGSPNTIAGTLSSYLRPGDSFTLTIPQGSLGRLGVGVSGPAISSGGFYESYPFILKSIELSSLTELTTIVLSLSADSLLTIAATNSSGTIAEISNTTDASVYKVMLDGLGIPYLSVTLILTNTSSIGINLGTYVLEEVIIKPFLVYVEDIGVVLDNEVAFNTYATAYGVKSKATKSESTAVGSLAQSTGSNSTSLGALARASEFRSTALGHSSLASGNSSVAVGQNSQATATFSIAIGVNSKSAFSSCIALGDASEAKVGNSISIGTSARAYGGSSIALGPNSIVSDEHNGSVAIGSSSTTSASQQVQLGNSSSTTYAYGAVQDRSDFRDKTDIQDVTLGLDFINSLRPVKYKWDYREDYFNELYPYVKREDHETEESYQEALSSRQLSRISFYANPVKDGSKTRSRYHHGLIAQELKSTLDTIGEDHAAFQDHSIIGGLDVKSIGYSELIPNLIKAIQELTQQNIELKSRLDSM